MLKILNIIFIIYYALSTIVITMMVFFMDFSFESELMLGLITVAIIIRLIIIGLEAKKNNNKK